ncbi:hypothetical protein KKD80_01500 [Patescibacteria group bacterium]|nr:hypothetical protein [Patescibacteria group bacterium]
MKKELTIVGLILAAGLIFLGAGCGQKSTENVNADANTNAAVNEETENVNAVNPGVTEEELNQLKSDIDELEYDDLNTLTQ